MAEIKHIFIICGEPSGDLNAASLAKAILQISPETKISGVGGILLRQTPATIYRDIKDLSVIGLFDVLKKLPKFFSLQKLILEKIKEEKPDAIILIDFSGFNLRLAKEINPSTTLTSFRAVGANEHSVRGRINGEPSRTINKTIPVIYYVSPQVWASRPGRVKTIKKYIHKMLVLFKFEEEFYKRYGIDAAFLGHPLLDIVGPTMEEKEFLHKFGLAEAKTTIALLPGSRKQEIKNILPVMLEASILIHKNMVNAQFVLAKSPQVGIDIYERIISKAKRKWGQNYFSNSKDGEKNNSDPILIEDKTYDCLNIADFCLVASGTATLETAIMQRPFVIIYKMNLLNYLLYRPQVKVPYIGMVNIVAGRKIVPEFIQFKARPKEISEQVLEILKDPAQLEQMKANLARVKSLLGEKGASLRAAQMILDFLSNSI